jgi:hypothetical protein
MVEKARSGFGRADLWVSQLGDGVVGRVEMLGERYVRCGYEGYECGNYRQSYKLYVLDLYWKCGSGGVQTLTIVAELWLVEANNGLSLSFMCYRSSLALCLSFTSATSKCALKLS